VEFSPCHHRRARARRSRDRHALDLAWRTGCKAGRVHSQLTGANTHMTKTETHRASAHARGHSPRLLSALGALALGGCVPDAPTDVTFTSRAHLMRVRDASDAKVATAAAPAAAPADARLTYYGGKVIEHVQVFQVNYGSGLYIPELTATTGPSMATAYAQMTGSGVFDWLDEYNTGAPAQAIGRGSYGGSFQITPLPERDGVDAEGHRTFPIADASIQAELTAQIAAHVLPAPSDRALYMVHFPRGKSITAPDGTPSCVGGGFCAYHGTFQIGAQNVYYGVLPDMTQGCAIGCGGAPTTFANQTSVASHELIEAITDAEVGLTAAIAAPLAWYDAFYGEIGDICNGQQGTFAGTDGVTYTIQQEFSNEQGDCITTRAVPPLATRPGHRLGDFNGDGHSDLLWRNTDGTVGIWLMGAGGVVAARLSLPDVIGTDWQIQATGNFDGDAAGTSDILWRRTDGTVGLWLMAPDATVKARITLPYAIGNDWQLQGTGDFNGDGRADLLWRSTTGTVGLWLMGPDGTVASRQNLPQLIPLDWQVAGVADFDGDAARTSDILWRFPDGRLRVWRMAGGAVLADVRVPEVIGTDWQLQGTGDFNGDGRADLLWRNTTGTVGVWLMGPSATVASRLSLPQVIGTDWQLQQTGNIDGDAAGTSDLLWRNVDGTLGIWTMAPDGSVGARLPVPFVIGNDWQLQG
jgi:hypothetical protein